MTLDDPYSEIGADALNRAHAASLSPLRCITCKSAIDESQCKAMAAASGLGTSTSVRGSVVVQIFTFILTDLIDFEAEPIKIELESEEEAGTYGANVAREMLEQMQELSSRGMCILILDESGETVSIVPLDPVS